jgi:methionine synthase II (cobalamin-independent)
MHEFLHVLLAIMKYGGDHDMRRKYYALINEIVNMDEYKPRYQELRKMYGERRDSDIKEELLVEVISNKFASSFRDSYNLFASNKNFEVTKSDIEDFVKNTLDSIFDIEIDDDLDSVTLGNTPFNVLISLFGKNLDGFAKNGIFSTILPEDTMVREIKASLFSNDQIDFNSECI